MFVGPIDSAQTGLYFFLTFGGWKQKSPRQSKCCQGRYYRGTTSIRPAARQILVCADNEASRTSLLSPNKRRFATSTRRTTALYPALRNSHRSPLSEKAVRQALAPPTFLQHNCTTAHRIWQANKRKKTAAKRIVSRARYTATRRTDITQTNIGQTAVGQYRPCCQTQDQQKAGRFPRAAFRNTLYVFFK